jgi:hypothetical protein
MRNEDVMYVDREDIEEYRKKGWKESETGYLPGDYHDQWGVLMFKAIPMEEEAETPIVYVRQTAKNKVEIVFGLRNHKATAVPISFNQARLINQDLAYALAGWPAQEVPPM